MAKPKSPLLSLGARGTIGDALTYQRRGKEHIVREKPTPTDPYSLAQAYQRWDYRDYAYLWTLLTNSEKQVYRTRASRYHITGFSLWMREHLKDLPDLLGRWHLDEKAGATAYDSSRHTNHGTIFGASPTNGLIDGAFHFDGLDDWINCGNSNLFTPPQLTLSVHSQVDIIISYRILAANYAAYPADQRGFCLLTRQFDGIPYLLARVGLLLSYTEIRTPIDPTLPFVGTMTYDGSILRLYLNGDYKAQVTASLEYSSNAFTIGRLSYQAAWYNKGLIDEVKLSDRAKDATEIKRHSERRYP